MPQSSSVGQVSLPQDTEYRNSLALIYYLTTRETLIEIYRSLNGNLEWTGLNWERFLSSIELDRLVHDKMAALSAFTQNKIAFCDPVGELDAVVFPGGVEVLCVPMVVHPRSKVVEFLEGPSRGITADAFGPIGIGQVATRQFIKVMSQMFLKDVLGMDFFIKGAAGFWRIGDKFKYELQTH